MRKFAVVLLMVGFAQASAFGGVVTFSPVKATVDLGAGDSTLVKFDVIVEQLVGTNDAFQSLDILIGSNDLELVSFAFEPSVLSAFFLSDIDDAPAFGVYADEIKLGGFALAAIPTTGPVLVGSLIADVSGLGEGNYQIIVDGNNDGDRSAAGNGAGRDPLVGLGSVNVIVPEPATITLLGMASLALLRRRKQA